MNYELEIMVVAKKARISPAQETIDLRHSAPDDDAVRHPILVAL
jgi:hypothetical protein